MGAGHNHGHSHGPPHGYRHRRPSGPASRIAPSITLSVMVVEIIGGIAADSLALIADAAHMATDAVGLGMALLAIHFAARPATENRTFGYARAEILAALANCVLLLGVGGFLLYEAIERFIVPPETRSGLTIIFALIGMFANLVSLSLLVQGQKDSLNVRGAYLEVLADTLGSLAVLVSAGIILATGWQTADPIAGLLIGVMIVPRTVKLLRETLNVLLESAPKDVDMGEVRAHMLALPGVADVHDLHAWTITSGMPVLSAHVVVDQDALDTVGHEKMLHDLQGCLGHHFDVEHCTFQLEPSGHAEHEAKLCH